MLIHYCLCHFYILFVRGLLFSQNHSSSPWEVISGHYLSKCTCKFDQKSNYVKLESVRILFKITRKVSTKSYLVISGPNSRDKLIKFT